MMYGKSLVAGCMLLLVAAAESAHGKFLVKETFLGEKECVGMECSQQQVRGTLTIKGEAELHGSTFDHFDGDATFTLVTGNLQMNVALKDTGWQPGDTGFTATQKLMEFGSNKAVTHAKVSVSWAKDVLKVKGKFNTTSIYSPAFADDFFGAPAGSHNLPMDITVSFQPTAGPTWGYSEGAAPGTAKVKRSEKTKGNLYTEKVSVKVSGIIE